jgi:hypothetical protein
VRRQRPGFFTRNSHGATEWRRKGQTQILPDGTWSGTATVGLAATRVASGSKHFAEILSAGRPMAAKSV